MRAAGAPVVAAIAASLLLVAGCVGDQGLGSSPCDGVTCDEGESCNPGTGSCGADTACVPIPCTDLAPRCLEVPDGCGGVWEKCGCGEGLSCDPASQICVPTCPGSCADYPGSCGSLPDGCGGTLSCGCGEGEACSADPGPGRCECVPPIRLACAAAGSLCGVEADGCGEATFCSCPQGLSCSPGSPAFAASCQPVTVTDCTRHAPRCGELAPGVRCQDCTGGQQCDAELHVCRSAAPVTCFELGAPLAATGASFAQEVTLQGAPWLYAVVADGHGFSGEVQVPISNGVPLFAEAVRIPGLELGGLGWGADLFVRPDGAELFFASSRPDRAWEDLDLYQSARVTMTDGSDFFWSRPALVVAADERPIGSSSGVPVYGSTLLRDYRTLIVHDEVDPLRPKVLIRPTDLPDDRGFVLQPERGEIVGAPAATSAIVPFGLSSDLTHVLARFDVTGARPTFHWIGVVLGEGLPPGFTDDGPITLPPLPPGEELVGATQSPDGQRLYVTSTTNRLRIGTPCP